MREGGEQKSVYLPILKEGSFDGLVRIGPLPGVEELLRGQTVKHTLSRRRLPKHTL